MADVSREPMPGDQARAGALPAIVLDAVNKWYGDFHVLRDVTLSVDHGERIVSSGPSGSGKSTLIRCINNLEEHQLGRIVVDGQELTGDLRQIDKIRSEVGMVFQQFNLFPHLTVLDSLTLAPIWVRRQPRALTVSSVLACASAAPVAPANASTLARPSFNACFIVHSS